MPSGDDVTEKAVIDRVLTIPNAISLVRLIVVAIALVILFGEHERVASCILLAFAGVTDFLDGFVARRIGQVSKLGAVLDPTVDRLVLGSSIIAILIYGAVPLWVACVVIVREASISVLALALALAGARAIDVMWLGKAGTFGLLVAFPLFLLADGPGGLEHLSRIAAYIIGVPAIAASVISLVAYAPVAQRSLALARGSTGGRA